MDAKTIWLYIVVMAGVTYLIRMLPLALLRKKLRSRFIKSFLFYVPYAVLAVMTVPAIFESTGSVFPPPWASPRLCFWLTAARLCCLWHWPPAAWYSARSG